MSPSSMILSKGSLRFEYHIEDNLFNLCQNLSLSEPPWKKRMFSWLWIRMRLGKHNVQPFVTRRLTTSYHPSWLLMKRSYNKEILEGKQNHMVVLRVMFLYWWKKQHNPVLFKWKKFQFSSFWVFIMEDAKIVNGKKK